MSYETSGSLTTDSRSEDDGDDLTWETQTDWEANQSKSNVVIESGKVKLAQSIPQTVIDNRYGHWIVSDVSASDGDSVTSVPDREASNDFTQPGTSDVPTYRTGGPNGEDYMEFASTSENLEAALGSELSPFTVVVVWHIETLAPSAQRGLQQQSSSGGHVAPRDNERASGGQILYAGSNQFITGAAGDTNWHIEVFVQNGGSSVIRQDGSQTGSGNPGTRGYGSTVTLDLDGGGNGDIAEIIAFDGDYDGTQTLSDAETYLSDKYGITI